MFGEELDECEISFSFFRVFFEGDSIFCFGDFFDGIFVS